MSDGSRTAENLTRQEAAARAAQVTGVTTRVHLVLGTGPEDFISATDLSFTVRAPGPSTHTAGDGAAGDAVSAAAGVFVDLTASRVLEVVLDGTELPASAVHPTRIDLGELTPGPHRLHVRARMPYQHQGKGLHRFVDPTDDEVYLHSQFEPFDAHLVFACFDQPDIKTAFELSVDAPAGWVVVSNARARSRPSPAAAGRWQFATTPPVSPYITAVVAGPYERRSDVFRREDGSSVELGWYCRRSLVDHLDTDELFEVTKQSLTAFEALFAQTYPFGDAYDQLFVPEFHAGAMENPGCVTFSETYVFRSKVTDAIRERRAETIVHEMAHMWFGDLVTMRWWDDLWLNESFATFMAVLVQASATRWDGAWVTFLDAEKAWAKHQDQLPSTHPVADEMPDVEAVHQNFDGITYAKGAAVLRQLVAWVGQDAFLAGCRAYFSEHAWGNATLADFLSALEDASGRALGAWRDEWLLTTGVNRLAPSFEVDDDGRYRGFVVEQTAPAPRWTGIPGGPPHQDILRRHRIAIGLYRRTEAGLEREARVEIDVSGSRTAVTELDGRPAADVILLNDDDLTYAKVALDPGSWDTVASDLAAFVDPLARAQAWAIAWDLVRDAELPTGRFVALVNRHIGQEHQIGVVQRLQLRAIAATERFGSPEARDGRLAELAARARAQLDASTPGSDHQLAWFRHWAVTVRDPDDLATLKALLAGDASLEGVHLDADLRWHLIVALCRRDALDAAFVDAEVERDGTDLGQRHAATARAARPDAEAKAAAFASLVDDDQQSHTLARAILAGFGQLDQAAVLRPYTARYFEVFARLFATRPVESAVQLTGGLFPHWDASPALLDQVDEHLRSPDVSGPAQRVLLEQRDTLARTLAARARDQRDVGAASA